MELLEQLTQEQIRQLISDGKIIFRNLTFEKPIADGVKSELVLVRIFSITGGYVVFSAYTTGSIEERARGRGVGQAYLVYYDLAGRRLEGKSEFHPDIRKVTNYLT